MDTSAWVTRPECLKGAKDEVKQAQRAQSRPGGPIEVGARRAPRLLVKVIFWKRMIIQYMCEHLNNLLTKDGTIKTPLSVTY